MIKGIDIKKLFQAVLISFLAIQILSWIISSVTEVPLVKGGTMFILFLVVVFISTLYSLGTNIENLKIKRDIPTLILVLGLLLLMYLILPDLVPGIFSASGQELEEFIRENIGTVLKVGTGVS